MNNRDPHMGGSSFEEIVFHDEVDDDYCRAITEAYRDSNMRVILQADHLIRQIPVPIHSRYPAPKKFEIERLSFPESDGILLDGKINGARMVPVKEYADEDESGELYDNSGEFTFVYKPYAVLADVVTIPLPGEQEVIVSDTAEEIWVPIELRNMTLYQPVQH